VKQLGSELDAIPGVGEKTVQKLLRQFGSSQRFRAAAPKVRAHHTSEVQP
jgi:excinuclease UvrABC nuclease subunit